jgi:hypothetical protein
MDPEVVELGKGISEDDLLFHDEKATEPTLAYLLSRMRLSRIPGADRRERFSTNDRKATQLGFNPHGLSLLRSSRYRRGRPLRRMWSASG